MKAIEIETTTINPGIIEVQISEKYINKKESLIILTEDELEEDEWLHAIASNPTFGFLNEPTEDIYSL